MLFPLGSESPTELPFSEVFGNPEGPLCGHELSCSFWWLEGCSPSYPGSCHLGGPQIQCPMPEAGKIRMLSLSLAGGQPWNCFPRKEGERNRPRAGDWRTKGAKTSHFPGAHEPCGGGGAWADESRSSPVSARLLGCPLPWGSPSRRPCCSALYPASRPPRGTGFKRSPPEFQWPLSKSLDTNESVGQWGT